MTGVMVFIGLVFLSGMIGFATISFRKNIEDDISRGNQDNRF